MAKKTFCDICDEEFPERSRNIYQGTASIDGSESLASLVFVHVQIMQANGKHELTKDVCRTCAWEILERMDPRKQPIEEAADANEN